VGYHAKWDAMLWLRRYLASGGNDNKLLVWRIGVLRRCVQQAACSRRLAYKT
jgi:hypothetical protein